MNKFLVIAALGQSVKCTEPGNFWNDVVHAEVLREPRRDDSEDSYRRRR